MAEKSTVLIVDDHRVVLEGISNLLEDEPDFEVVGTATEGKEGLSLLQALGPDILVLDITMPGPDGVEVAEAVREKHPDTRILVYTMHSSREYIAALFRAGVSAYVLKEEPLSELIQALKSLREGGTFFSSQVHEVLQDHMKELELGEEGKDVAEVRDGIAKLSPREKEVFVLLADGTPVKEIARRLAISPKTVETHKYNIMEKLGLHSLAQFTKIAIKKDLIHLD